MKRWLKLKGSTLVYVRVYWIQLQTPEVTDPIIGDKPHNATNPISDNPHNATNPIRDRPHKSTITINDKPNKATNPISDKPHNATNLISEMTLMGFLAYCVFGFLLLLFLPCPQLPTELLLAYIPSISCGSGPIFDQI